MRDAYGKNQRAERYRRFEERKIMFIVYILKSETTNKHYYGHTKDLDQRLKAHNNGRVRSTKSGRPWKVIYCETFSSKSEAYKRELFFKSIDGYNFLKDQKII